MVFSHICRKNKHTPNKNLKNKLTITSVHIYSYVAATETCNHNVSPFLYSMNTLLMYERRRGEGWDNCKRLRPLSGQRSKWTEVMGRKDRQERHLKNKISRLWWNQNQCGKWGQRRKWGLLSTPDFRSWMNSWLRWERPTGQFMFQQRRQELCLEYLDFDTDKADWWLSLELNRKADRCVPKEKILHYPYL